MMPFHYASAISMDFHSKSMDTNEQQRLFSEVNITISDEEQYPNETVKLFDVDQNGNLIVTLGNGKYLNLYDSNGEFIQSYKIKTVSGGALYAFFDKLDGNIILYDIRRNCFYKIDHQANLVEVVAEDSAADQKNSEILAERLLQLTIKQEGVTYQLKTLVPFIPTSKIIMNFSDNHTKVLYDQTQNLTLLILESALLMAIVLIGYFSYRKIKKKKSKREQTISTPSI